MFSGHLASLGWAAHEYKYIPEPKIRIPSKLIGLWHESAPWDHEILGEFSKIEGPSGKNAHATVLFYHFFTEPLNSVIAPFILQFTR